MRRKNIKRKKEPQYKKVRIMNKNANNLNFNLIKKKSNKRYFLFSFILIVILSILFIIRIFWIKYHSNEYDDFDDIKPTNESIYYEEKFDSHKEAFNKAKDFINNNMKGILINTQIPKPSNKPKISVVIPCHNCKEFVIQPIRSIQNQNFSDVEIIIINDFSSDNTLTYLEQLMNEDHRIKILSNKKNMGMLYSITVGIFSAKGKYIFPSDSDDMFSDKDVFSTVINIAEKGNFDIVLFDVVVSDLQPNVYTASYTFDIHKERKPNLVLFQPELSYYPIQPNPGYNNLNLVEVLINGRCIKRTIYKQALNKIGEERYSRYINYDADIILNYINFNTARSMKYIAKLGYVYIKRKGSITSTQSDGTRLLIYRIFMLDILIEMSKNTFGHKKILVNLVIYVLRNHHLKEALNRSKYNYDLFISCLNRIMNSEFISDKDKNEIRKIGKKLNFINYNF